MLKHPSKGIIGSVSDELSGMNIVVAVTSGIAIYRVPDIVRGLMRRGANVYVVMSKEATKLVSPEVFRWASGNEVFVEFKGEVGHVALSRECNALLIIPATANTLSKVANGIADTSVTLLTLNFMGLRKKVIAVPTMHEPMYRSPQVKEVIRKLKSYGVYIIEPVVEQGKAKIPSNEEIVERVATYLARGLDFKGIKALVTAGPTREFLDPVRFLTNASTGRMGVAIAKELTYRGAEVILVHGPLCGVEPPRGILKVAIETTEDMLREVKNIVAEMRDLDLVVMAAAPADFRFKVVSKRKLDSSKGFLVELEPTPKILPELRKLLGSAVIVGFAAETVGGSRELLVKKAKEKLLKYGVDLIVANDVSRKDIGFASLFNEVAIVRKDGRIRYVNKMRKEVIARVIVDEIRGLIRK